MFSLIDVNENRDRFYFYLTIFCAVVEQQLKKCCNDKLVLGCFFDLAFAASVGHVCKSVEKYVKSDGKCVKVKKCKNVETRFLRFGRTTVAVMFVVVLLLFFKCTMLNPTWVSQVLDVVEQQTLCVVLLQTSIYVK
jgi:hypothetical protein